MTPKQVVSLELARELDEKGIVVESCFTWYFDLNSEWVVTDNGYDLHKNYQKFPAPQTDELLAVLPDYISDGDIYIFDMIKVCMSPPYYICRYILDNILNEGMAKGEDRSPCNALAKLLIYLYDNQLLEKE